MNSLSYVFYHKTKFLKKNEGKIRTFSCKENDDNFKTLFGENDLCEMADG